MIQFRGSEVIELEHFEPASIDDIASVHARAYVSGLEKVTFYVKKNPLFGYLLCERLCFVIYGIFFFIPYFINCG